MSYLGDRAVQFMDKNGDTLQKMALLAYLRRGEEAQPFLETVTTAGIAVDVYKRLSSESSEVEEARQRVILNVAAYVKANPRARPGDIQQKVNEEIQLFRQAIN